MTSTASLAISVKPTSNLLTRGSLGIVRPSVVLHKDPILNFTRLIHEVTVVVILLTSHIRWRAVWLQSHFVSPTRAGPDCMAVISHRGCRFPGLGCHDRARWVRCRHVLQIHVADHRPRGIRSSSARPGTPFHTCHMYVRNRETCPKFRPTSPACHVHTPNQTVKLEFDESLPNE